MTHHLVGLTEIAEMLGVTKQRVTQLARDYDDFPRPEAELAGGRVWKRAAIEAWVRRHPVRPSGRRPKARH
jgi:predicted DNA-binding transcriptional regulator AlpA